MNTHTHNLIFNRKRGCLMAVAETAKSSGKASGSVRSRKQSKPKTPTCRKARSALSSSDMWLQANQGKAYSLPCLRYSFSSFTAGGSITGANAAIANGVRANTGYAATSAGSLLSASPRSGAAAPANGLFAPSANKNATYFIETNPQFANYKHWLSSDYLLNATNFDPLSRKKD